MAAVPYSQRDEFARMIELRDFVEWSKATRAVRLKLSLETAEP
jgi:hypothetical protein